MQAELFLTGNPLVASLSLVGSDLHVCELQRQCFLLGVLDQRTCAIVVDANIAGPTDDLSMDLRVGYFMGDNYIGLGAGDIMGDLDFGLRFGHYIDFKDVLYISPNLQYNFGLPDGASDNLQIQIGFGTRF